METHEERRRAAKDEHKAIVKEAISEWLDAKYAQFGKWTLHGILAAAVGWLGYLVLIANGWHK